MKKYYALLLGIFSTVLIYSQVPGTPPQGFSYKAIITKANGANVANRIISLKISILQGSMIGIPVYTEVFHPKTNEFGQIDIIIGESGFGSIPWDQGPFFLKTEVDDKGGTDFFTLSITQLLSVPYALHAGSASMLNESDPIFKAHDAYQYSPSLLDKGNTAYSWGDHAGLYRPLSWVPDWSDLTGKPSFSSVATTGSYTDLLNKPSMFDGTWANLSGKPSTIDGYGITDAMTISHAANGITSGMISNWSAAYTWGNHVGLYRLSTWVPAWSDVTDKPGFSSVAISGSYNDLTDKPVLFDGTWTSLTSKPSSVSGYGITDAMTSTHPANGITSTMISNWNSAYTWGPHAGLYRSLYWVPAWSDVTGKPSFSTVALTGSYTDLLNKPVFVTSVALSLPAIFSLSGSPVTGTGTLAASLVSQSANLVFASPAQGPGTPTFRSLVTADIPNLDWGKINSGKPTTVSGYGIIDAVTLNDPQEINGIKNFSSDLLIHYITAGRGHGSAVTNTAFGVGSLAQNAIEAGDNSAFGSYSLTSNTSGNTNSAFGSNSLRNNTQGSNNSAFGWGSLESNLNGTGNSAFGSNSLRDNIRGNYNSAFGSGSLESNIIGAENSAFGYSSLYRNDTGTGNSAFGSNSLKSNIGGGGNSAFGSNSLRNNIQGYENSAFGWGSLTSNTSGSSNSAFGSNSLESNLSGGGNSAFGSNSLTSNTSGSSNSAFGSNSLRYNTGNYNSAFGSGSLEFNRGGAGNSAFGYNSLYRNDIGIGNSAFGSYSLTSNTSGSSNSAFGSNSLTSNTGGYGNSAFGSNSLESNITGAGNSAFGSGSLSDNTGGNYNSAFGSNSLTSNTSGYSNSAFGSNSLTSNNEGYSNSAFGSASLASNTEGHDNSAFGVQSLQNNQIGNENIAVGKSALSSNFVGNRNAAIGAYALYQNNNDDNVALGAYGLNSNTGSHNTSVGGYALSSNITGSYNTAIGYNANVTTSNLTNATAIGSDAFVNASNKVRIGNSSVVTIEGQVNWSTGSDIRLKDNITYSDALGLDFVNGLRTVTFTYKNDPDKRHHDGLIAQDVQKIMQEHKVRFSGLIETESDDNILNLSYAEFVIPLINSVKELSKENENQKRQLNSVIEDNQELKSQLVRLQKEVELLKSTLKNK